jgi:hypothetical protein
MNGAGERIMKHIPVFHHFVSRYTVVSRFKFVLRHGWLHPLPDANPARVRSR